MLHPYTHLGAVSAIMVTLLVYLCILALAPYASDAIQSGNMDPPATRHSYFINYREILLKVRKNTNGHEAQSRRLAGQCSQNFYNKPFFVSDM